MPQLVIPMDENTTDMALNMTECPRHAGVETNLRCSRCEDPICPRCMIYAPVGSKCPDCASIGGPEIFKVTQNDLIRTGLLGGVAAIVLGAIVALVLSTLWSLDILEGAPQTIWLILVGVAQFAGIMGVSQAMFAIGGRKYSTSLRILAAVLALVFYVSEVMFVDLIGRMFPGLLLNAGIVVHLPGMIGFAFGTYYAMQRFRAL